MQVDEKVPLPKLQKLNPQYLLRLIFLDFYLLFVSFKLYTRGCYLTFRFTWIWFNLFLFFLVDID